MSTFAEPEIVMSQDGGVLDQYVDDGQQMINEQQMAIIKQGGDKQLFNEYSPEDGEDNRRQLQLMEELKSEQFAKNIPMMHQGSSTGGGRQQREIYKRDFKELFKYDENERDKRELKKDFKKIEKKFKSPLQFKDLIGKFILFAAL